MDTETANIEIFKNNLTTFKEASRDNDNGINRYMTESKTKVINFDKVKEKYIKGMGLSEPPCSVDALHIKGQVYNLIEFKNGKMKGPTKFNVQNKIYDSLLIFNDITHSDISFCREHVNFILVYNESKNPNEAQENSSRVSIGKYFSGKAGRHFIRFDLEKFQKIYFKGVYTYTENEFEEFLEYSNK